MRWSVTILCLICINSFSQQASIDSLEKLLVYTKGDTSKANILCDISDYYRGFDYDSALHYAMQALQLSRKKFPKGEMRSYATAGIALRYSGNYTTAIEFFLRGLQLAEKHK